MRYAITYTTNETWNTTDTIILDLGDDKLPVEQKQLENLLSVALHRYGLSELEVENIITDGLYYVVNVDDVIVELVKGVDYE